MKNWQLRFGLFYLSFMRFFLGRSFMCSHVFIKGVYLHKGKSYKLKCAICQKFHLNTDDYFEHPIVGESTRYPMHPDNQ